MHDVFKQCLADMQNFNLAMARAATDARSAKKVTPDTFNIMDPCGLTKRVKHLEAALEECLEYFKDRYDVVDGSYGEPSPNKEMQLGSTITEALYGPGVV